MYNKFQPTRPVWDATKIIKISEVKIVFQPTRPVWDATRIMQQTRIVVQVSTHASRVGRDHQTCFYSAGRWVSTHASRVGRDCYNYNYTNRRKIRQRFANLQKMTMLLTLNLIENRLKGFKVLYVRISLQKHVHIWSAQVINIGTVKSFAQISLQTW